MTTLRERLTAAGISDQQQQAHLEAGFLGVAGERVTTLDVEIPDGSHDFGIYPWPEPTAEERAEVAAQLAAMSKARDDAAKQKSEPTGW